jgi:hypothetical protein
MSLPGNSLLTQVEAAQDVPTLAVKLGQYIRRYLGPSIQNVASNAAVDPSSEIQPPAPPESINVTTSGELMQVTINHTAPVIRGARHFTEISADDPSFNGSMIHDHGASRAPLPIQLPTKDGSGNTHKYYVASYVQYPGGPPSAPTFFGGSSPAAVTMSGTTEMDIAKGTGSGTATNGGQTFQGLGKAVIRR